MHRPTRALHEGEQARAESDRLLLLATGAVDQFDVTHARRRHATQD